VNQPNKNFGPTVGFAYNPPFSQKTVLRGGFGIYYDSNVFNNVQFDRASRLQTGEFASYTPLCIAGYQLGSLTQTSTGISIKTLCSESIAAGAPGWLQLQSDFRALNSAAAVNQGSAAYGLAIQSGDIAFAPKYKSPYSINFNFGFQQELMTGMVLSADYVHIDTMRLGQTIDANHVGDSQYLDPVAAAAAISTTEAAFGCTSIDCVAAAGGTITDFASNGLDSGVTYLSGHPGSAYGLAAAFPGVNPNVGVGTFQYPEGRAGYDGLQLNLREQKAHPLPGLLESNFEASYAFSRLVSSAGNNGLFAGSDPFFTSPSYNNRNENGDIGWGGLDRTNIFSFGGAITLIHGPVIGVIGHFESAVPTNLAIDNQGNAPGEIFRSDVNGDGQTGDLIPGTRPGAYMREYGPNNLNKLISNYNAQNAGQLTPAGQALVSQGLFTSSQLAALGAVTPTLAPADSHAFPNSPLRTMDANFTYPIHPKWFREGISLEPGVAMYNVLNMANYGGPIGTVLTSADAAGTTGYVNSPYVSAPGGAFAVKNGFRTSRKTGTFDQGAPRATEFSLKFNF
jgi:hypothetical protein